MSRLQVGMYTGRQVVQVGDQLVAEIGLGRVVSALLRTYPDLVLAAVDAGEANARHSETLRLPPENWLRLPAMPSFGHGVRHTWTCRRVMHELEARSDVVLTQLTFQTPVALLAPQKPRVYHLFSDALAMASGSTRYRGPTRAVAVAYAHFVDRVQARLFRHPQARLVTNGEALLRHYGGQGRAVVSSSLNADDIESVQRRRPPPPPHRILFVAHLRHEKGIDVLLAAFDKVRATTDVELELVGPGDPAILGPQVVADLDRGIAAGAVHLAGMRPYGPDLFQHFVDADLFVLPSRSEGTPRVLVEARAFGCPVVATTAGGIPTSVTDGVDGVLVPPEDPDALADAIVRVLEDRDLRARLIAAGRARAMATTAEAFAGVLVEELEALGAPAA